MKLFNLLVLFSSLSYLAMGITPLECKTFDDNGNLLSTNTLNMAQQDPADSYTVAVKKGDWTYSLVFSVYKYDGDTQCHASALISSNNDKTKQVIWNGFESPSQVYSTPLEFSIFYGDLTSGQSGAPVFASFKINCK